MVIFIRMGNVYSRYKDIKRFVRDNEHVSGQRSVRGRTIKTALILYLLLGALMMMTVAGTFAAFYILVHLGWTTLVTSSALVLMYAAYGLFSEQLADVVELIRTDQHKAVTHEAVLLLKEGIVALSGDQRVAHFKRTNRYLTALRLSTSFKLPEYIDVVEGFDFETIALKQLESSV